MNAIAQLPRPAPKASELEALLLGCLLEAEDPGGLIDLSGLAPADLQDARVRMCWDLITRLLKRRRPCDAVSLFSSGKAVSVLHDGDLAWLQGLQAANNLDQRRFAAVAEDLRKITRGRAIAQQLEEQARAIRSNGLRPAEVAGTLEGITLQLARDYVGNSTADGDVVEVVDDWFRAREPGGNRLHVPTGIKILDDQIQGFAPSLNMILGDAQIGKSGASGTMIEQQVLDPSLGGLGLTVGLFGLEEGSKWLTKRLFARELGIKIGDVGRDIPVPGSDLEAKILETAPRLSASLKRLLTYTMEGVGIDEVIRRSTDWILNHKCQIIYIDHIGEIRHRFANGSGGSEGYNWAVADSYRRLRDLANKRGVPIVVLAHRKPDARERKGPPKPNDVGLTGEAEKMVRRMLGLWRSGPADSATALRATVLKNNEGATDITIEFERFVTAGLVDAHGGRVVNLEAEAREIAREKALRAQEIRDAEAFRTRTRSKQWAAAEKARSTPETPPPEAAVPPPQLDLLAGAT